MSAPDDVRCKAFTALSFKQGKPQRCTMPVFADGWLCGAHQRIFDQGGDIVVLTKRGQIL